MKKRKSIYLLTVLILILISTSCDLPWTPGPMPTDIIETDYVPSLNIFGILCNDGTAGSSFFLIERIMKTEEIYNQGDTFDILIEDALVIVTDSLSGDTTFFSPSADSLYEGFYYNDAFLPVAGRTYLLTIAAPYYPVVSAKTVVPSLPDIDTSDIDLDDDILKFNLNLSPDCYQYNWYLIYSEGTAEGIIQGAVDISKTVSVGLNAAYGNPLTLSVSALDKNLTAYNNSSLSIIPQTFHEDGSTVSGGFGCFGSVSTINYTLK